jgi:hypothetical protein
MKGRIPYSLQQYVALLPTGIFQSKDIPLPRGIAKALHCRGLIEIVKRDGRMMWWRKT